MGSHYLGLKDWTFPCYEALALMRLCSGSSCISADDLEAWGERIARRVAIMGGCNVAFLQVLTPSRLAVFPEQFALPMAYPDFSPARRIFHHVGRIGLASRVLDLAGHLRHDPDKFTFCDPGAAEWSRPVWLRTGHHMLAALTALGAGSAASPLGEKNRAGMHSLSDANTIGQAYLKQRADGFSLPEVGARLVFGSALLDDPARTIVIFDDGFFFRNPFVLFDTLSPWFAEVHLLCSRDIDFSYVARVDSRVVASSISEHLLGTMPNDQWDITVEEWHYAEARRQARS